jgi:hypothetical protein
MQRVRAPLTQCCSNAIKMHALLDPFLMERIVIIAPAASCR